MSLMHQIGIFSSNEPTEVTPSVQCAHVYRMCYAFTLAYKYLSFMAASMRTSLHAHGSFCTTPKRFNCSQTCLNVRLQLWKRNQHRPARGLWSH